MKNSLENLEGVVSKLKEQGINAGEAEKQRIIDLAKEEAKSIINKAEAEANDKYKKAESDIVTLENNSKAALKQASRDFVESTKISILNHLQRNFADESEKLFTEEQYLKELLKVALESIPGDKVVSVTPELSNKMEEYLKSISFKENIEIKPLPNSEAKILIDNTEKNKMQFVLSSEDVQDGLFSLINKDLINKITKEGEE